jgi:hypothetical protein
VPDGCECMTQSNSVVVVVALVVTIGGPALLGLVGVIRTRRVAAMKATDSLRTRP